jgi:hypothetical protein
LTTEVRGKIEQPGDRQRDAEDRYACPTEAGITPPAQRRANYNTSKKVGEAMADGDNAIDPIAFRGK